MEFRDILRVQRKKLNLTLDDVGRAVGVSGATVSRWENGDIENIRRDKIGKLADVLHVTPAYLMGWPEKNSSSDDDDDSDESYIILSRNAKKLSPEQRKQLLDVARVMFKEEFKD